MQYLVERAVDRVQPHQDDINKIAEREFNEEFKTDGGAVIDHFSAISLLKRYCDILPSDQFTDPIVTWRRTDTNEGKIQVHIQLPIQSPISDEISVSPCAFDLMEFWNFIFFMFTVYRVAQCLT